MALLMRGRPNGASIDIDGQSGVNEPKGAFLRVGNQRGLVIAVGVTAYFSSSLALSFWPPGHDD
jgi:hypothetical protein